jgi:hypothetical protein
MTQKVGRALLELVQPSKKSDATKKSGKRMMSAEAHKKIGDAQRKRWAAQKKAAK